MTTWPRIREIFEQVVDLPLDQRQQRLGELCRGLPELRAEVEELLERDSAGSDAAIDSAPDLDLVAPNPARIRRIGAYEIVRVLGSGGMGTVFEARQERPQRTVALKVLRAFVSSEAARRRLEYEAETLGRLRHPNVAQIHESGTWNDPDTGEELPFFAMEFVVGAKPIDEYAASRQLDLEGRIELFLTVCDAVHHGHQVGVLHRDLKPANVLVDADGRVKVIDFGIARATDTASRTVQTLPGQALGTPGYMSPEQIDGDAAQVDVRADVYSLGATLYQLLVGAAPHDRGTDSMHRFVERIRRDPPGRPSTRTDASVAVPAELDWVVLRTLAPDPEERYPSVSDLAADLRRYLAAEPLTARPPTRGYLLRKFVRRNRLPVTAVAAVLLAMVIGTIGTAIGWRRAVAAEQVAERRREAAVAAEQVAERRRQEAAKLYDELWYVTEFQAQILRGSRGNKDALLVDVLDRASADLEFRPPSNERTAGAVFGALAASYLDLGYTDRAQRHFEEALKRLNEDSGAGTRRTLLGIRGNYSSLLMELGRLEEAENVRRDVLRGKIEEYGEDHWLTAITQGNLASVLMERGNPAEAVPLYRGAIAVWQREGDHARRLPPLTGLAICLHMLGRDDEAAPLYAEACELAEQLYGADDAETLSTRNTYASFLSDSGRFDEAAEMLRELWTDSARVAGPAHRDTLRVASNLGLIAERQERYADAEAIYRQILATREQAGVALEATDLITRFNLCVALHRQAGDDKLADALQELDRLLVDAAGMYPPDNWRLAVFRQHRGIVLRKMGRFGEAEADLIASRAVLEEGLGPDHSRTRSNWEESAVLYEAWGRPEDAAVWREKLEKR